MTDSEDNSVSLVIGKLRGQDDGPYVLVVENEHGTDQATVKLYITDASGLDFRNLLKHRYIIILKTAKFSVVVDFSPLELNDGGSNPNENNVCFK